MLSIPQSSITLYMLPGWQLMVLLNYYIIPHTEILKNPQTLYKMKEAANKSFPQQPSPHLTTDS